MAVTFKKPVDENVPWDQRLANYAGNKDAGQTEYQRALEVYRGKSALGDTQGANQAKTWSDQVNTAIGGIGNNRTAQMNNANDAIGQKVNATPFEFKQTQAPFQYNNPQADPLYQTALKQAQLGAQTAGNDAMVSLGSRGIGNSSITSDRVAQIQQKAVGDVNATVLPQLMQQAYGRYQDQNNNDYKNQLMNYQAGQDQVKNLTGYANTLNGLNQQDTQNQFTGAGLTGELNGQRTLAGQQLDYQKLQDQVKNGQWDKNFDLEMQKFADDKGIKWATLDMETKKAMASLAIEQNRLGVEGMNAQTSRMNAQTNANQAVYQMDPNSPHNQYYKSLANYKDSAGNNMVDKAYQDAISSAYKSDPTLFSKPQDQQDAVINSFYARLKAQQPQSSSGMSDQELMQQLSKYMNK